jgi:TrmH family RNA methyltransferase
MIFLPASNEADRLVVVLVRPRNPLNIGAVARAMSNFGFRRLRVVNPYEVAFREARSAVGAAELLVSAGEYKNVADAVADCTLVVGTTAVRHRELQHPLRRLDEHAGRLISDQLRSGPVALLFGSEKVGLSNDDLSHCHWLLHIPTREDHISMNLGQAAAVCLYELVRQKKDQQDSMEDEVPVSADGSTLANSGDLERITSMLLETLHICGYVNAGTEISTEEKLRRMILRLNIRSGDAAALLSMFAQIIWKLEKEK